MHLWYVVPLLAAYHTTQYVFSVHRRATIFMLARHRYGRKGCTYAENS